MGGSRSASGGYSQSKSSTESASTNKTKEQKKWLGEALALYGPQLGQNENIWQGDRVTPFSSLQSDAIAGASNFSDDFSTPQRVGTPLLSETGTAIKGLLAGEGGAQKMGDQDIQDYYKATAYNPAMASLRDDVLPGVDEAYSGPGFYGSARSHARQDASENTRDMLAEQYAKLNWDVQQQNQGIDEARANRSLAATAPAMSFGQLPAQEVKNNLSIAAQQIGGLNTLFGIGAQDQTQDQMELESEIMKFAEENALTDPENLSVLLTLLGLNFSDSYSKGASRAFGLNMAASG